MTRTAAILTLCLCLFRCEPRIELYRSQATGFWYGVYEGHYCGFEPTKELAKQACLDKIAARKID